MTETYSRHRELFNCEHENILRRDLVTSVDICVSNTVLTAEETLGIEFTSLLSCNVQKKR